MPRSRPTAATSRSCRMPTISPQAIPADKTCSCITGSTGTTDLVDVTTAGGRPRFGAWQPAISGNGRFVAFVSASADMAVPASGRINVYLRDLGRASPAG